MKAVLVQHKCAKALTKQTEGKKEKETLGGMIDQERQEMDELASSLLILNLSDNVLR